MIDWDNLTSEEKRIEIAKDVIVATLSKVYTPKLGGYIDMGIFETPFRLDESLQGILVNNKLKDCKVCAIGACFLSYIKYQNNFSVGEVLFNSGNCFRQRLLNIFSREQLGLIESAFENSTCFSLGITTLKEAERAANWYKNIDDNAWSHQFNENRLLGIMQNIIDNNGTFIP